MAIYSYKCSNCGFEDDCLEKISDRPEHSKECPKCHEVTFNRGISTNTAFHLKGSGWYKSSNSP